MTVEAVLITVIFLVFCKEVWEEFKDERKDRRN